MTAPQQGSNEDGATQQQPTDSTSSPAATQQPPKKKRRVGKVILILALVMFLGLIVLVALAPTLASTRTGTDLALSFANKQIAGELNAERLNIAWFSESGIRDLEVKDPEGRTVLQVDNAHLGGGLWSAFDAMDNFGRVVIEAPQVVLYMNEDGEISLARAFETRSPSPKKEKTEDLELPEGVIVLKNGSVKAVQADGRTYMLDGISIELALGDDGEVEASFSMDTPDDVTIRGAASLAQLIDDGAFTPTKAKGEFSLESTGPVELAPLAAFLSADARAGGTATINAKGAFDAGAIEADARIAAEQFTAGAAGHGSLNPTNLALSAQLQSTKEEIAGDIDFTGDPGRLAATFKSGVGAAELGAALETWMDDALGGTIKPLPAMELAGDGEIDIARLAEAVPALLQVREDVEIASGTLKLAQLSAEGGDSPKAGVMLELTGLTARTPQGAATVQPISVAMDASAPAGGVLKIDRADIRSGFATVAASGTPDKLNADINADLSAMVRELGQIFDLGGIDLSGQLAGKATMDRTTPETFDIAMNLTGSGIAYRTGQTAYTVQNLTFEQQGVLHKPAQGESRLEVTRAQLDADSKLRADLRGSYNLDSGACDATVNIPLLDLAYVRTQLNQPAPGEEGMPELAGTVSAQMTAKGNLSDKQLKVDGSADIRQLAFDGQPVTDRMLVSLSGIDTALGDERINAAKIEVTSDVANLSASDLKAQFGEWLSLDGKVTAQAELDRVGRLAARLAGSEAPPAMRGKLDLSATCSGNADGFGANGTARIDGVELQRDQRRYTDNITVTYNATLERKANKVTLNKLTVESGLLQTEITGNVADFTDAMNLALDGNYRLAWSQVNELLAVMSPSAAKLVAFEGEYRGALKANGPANTEGAQPAYRDLKASVDVGWESADVYGIKVSGAKLTPQLGNGVVNLPAAEISAMGGLVRLGGGIDLRPKTPVLNIPDRLKVLEKITVTPEIGNELLSRFNPVFSDGACVEGRLDLQVANIVLPLGEGLEGRSSGSGVLTLTGAKMQPDGLFAMLIELGELGKKELYAVTFSGLNFQIIDGRIHYKDFTMAFAEGAFDLSFYGSVGFDDTLDLVVSIPARSALLERLGVKGKELGMAKRLEGMRVDIPITGTRQQPKLDLAKVDVEKLLGEILKEAALQGGLDQAGDLLKDSGLLGGKKNEKDGDKAKEGESDDGKDAAKEAIGGLLDQFKKKDKEKEKDQGGRSGGGRRGGRR